MILPHIIDKIRATYFKSVEFFQQHNIVSIDLYSDGGSDFGLPLYDEECKVSAHKLLDSRSLYYRPLLLSPSQTGSTPLFRASFAGNIDQVKDLLKGRANVNEANDVSWPLS